MRNRTPRRKRVEYASSPNANTNHLLLSALQAMKGHGLFLPARCVGGTWISSQLICRLEPQDDGASIVNFWHLKPKQRWKEQTPSGLWLGCVMLLNGKVVARGFETDHISASILEASLAERDAIFCEAALVGVEYSLQGHGFVVEKFQKFHKQFHQRAFGITVYDDEDRAQYGFSRFSVMFSDLTYWCVDYKSSTVPMPCGNTLHILPITF